MKKKRCQYRTRLPFSAETVFQWHERAGALERLTPPWERVTVIHRSGGIRDGDRVVLRVSLGPFGLNWTILHQDYIENRQFRDVQVSGPFSFWEHLHRIEPDGPHACFLDDQIEYALPLSALTHGGGDWCIRRKLDALFAYRHRVINEDLHTHGGYPQREGKRILVSGSSGLIGSAAMAFLSTGGHTAYRLVRNSSQFDNRSLLWPESGKRDNLSAWEGFDTVIHLAGETISGRWTNEKKQQIRDSRILGTRKLCQILTQISDPPKTLICASAIGFYGNREGEILTEQSDPGDGFLAQTCQEWEGETQLAVEAGIRVVNLRLGVVLTPGGGALAQMWTPFRLGVGGVIGDGSQYVSWISIDDVLGAILHAMMTDTLQGPINVVSPHPVTNRELTKTVGEIFHRPTFLPLPAVAVRTLFGEMGTALLLSSTRVIPQRLLETGYAFRHPTLVGALRHLLGKGEA